MSAADPQDLRRDLHGIAQCNSAAGLLFGGGALYLATFGYTRWRMSRRVATTRLTTAGVLLLLLPLAAIAPALVAVGLLAAAIVGLNITDHQLRRRASPHQAAGGNGHAQPST